MAQVRFIIDAEAGRAIQEFLKVVQAQGKVEGGFRKIASTGAQSVRQVERELNRMALASERASAATVAGVRMRTTGSASAALSLSPAQRALLATSTAPAAAGTDVAAVQAIAMQRRLRAQVLRQQRADDRAFANLLALERATSGMAVPAGARVAAERGTWTSRYGRNLGRWEQQGNAAFDAASIGYFAGGGGGARGLLGDDAVTRKARRYVARNVAATPELKGKVTPEQLETMAGVRAAQVRRNLEVRNNIATGALAVGAALGGVAAAAEQELNRYADAILSFDDAMRPLYGVGDNMRRRPQLRGQVLAQSTGYGIDAAGIAGLRFSMESAASDLAPDVAAAIAQESIKFNRLQGSDMQSVALALVGGLQIAKGELPAGAAGVRSLSNKLAYAADVGAFEVDEFTPYQSMILAAFKGTGRSVDEALAASAVASKSGMRPETWATGVRNLPLLLAAAADEKSKKKKGFAAYAKAMAGKGWGAEQIMSGWAIAHPDAAAAARDALPKDFGALMKQLAAMEAPELLDLVGRDPFVIAKILGENAGLVTQYAQDLGRIGPGNDVVGRKLGAAYTDPMFATTETIRMARQGQANAPASVAEDLKLGPTLADWEVRKLGAAVEVHPAWSYLGRLGVWAESVTGMNDEDSYLAAGARHLIAQSLAAGNKPQADYLSLQYGFATGSYYTGAEGERIYTDKRHADQFARYRTTGGYDDLTAEEYREVLRLQAVDPSKATEYLRRVGVRKNAAAAAGASAGGGPGGGGGGDGDIERAGMTFKQAADVFAGAVNQLVSRGGGGGGQPAAPRVQPAGVGIQ